jgi:hypothetical protein
MTEQEKIATLEAQGYTVEEFNLNGEKFNERYVVYKNMPPLGNKIVCIDEDGNVIGSQG